MRFDSKSLQGRECLHLNGQPTDYKIADYWRWAHSDLLSNTERGVLAEYIVGKAIGNTSETRKEWEPFDFKTKDGIKIEVKSAAYIQSWYQKRQSRIVFNISLTKYWDSDKGIYEGLPKRQSDVYVFSLLGHKDSATIDPLNISQWEFYVIATDAINKRMKDQKTISISVLEKIGAKKCSYKELGTIIKEKNMGITNRWS